MLRWECYEDSRSGHPMDGVLVIQASLAVPPFAHQDRHIWLLPIDPGSERPPWIEHMISAVGVHEEGRGWKWSEI